MWTQGVDPRDTEWEAEHPTYRVYFWRRLGSAPDVGWAADEWEIGDADIVEVLTWANAEAQGRSFVVYARSTDNGRPGLLRLFGTDPTVTSPQ